VDRPENLQQVARRDAEGLSDMLNRANSDVCSGLLDPADQAWMDLKALGQIALAPSAGLSKATHVAGNRNKQAAARFVARHGSRIRYQHSLIGRDYTISPSGTRFLAAGHAGFLLRIARRT
jgi:hypothetical protein